MTARASAVHQGRVDRDLVRNSDATAVIGGLTSTIPRRVETLVERRELTRLLFAALSRLPGRYRAAVVLCDLEEMSSTDASMVLGVDAAAQGSRSDCAANCAVIGSTSGGSGHHGTGR